MDLEKGQPVTFICDRPTAGWQFLGSWHFGCKDCPSTTCDIGGSSKARYSLSCSENQSILVINSTTFQDDRTTIGCRYYGYRQSLHLRVGSYDGRLRVEKNSSCVAYERECTLVCDIEPNEWNHFLNDRGQYIIMFLPNCETFENNLHLNVARFNFTCDSKQKKLKLHIKNVTMKDNGRTFGCDSTLHSVHDSVLSLYRLEVIDQIPDVTIPAESMPDVTTPDVSNDKTTAITQTTRSTPSSRTTIITWTSQNTPVDSSVLHIQTTHFTPAPRSTPTTSSTPPTTIILSCMIVILAIILIVLGIKRKNFGLSNEKMIYKTLLHPQEDSDVCFGVEAEKIHPNV